MRHSRPRHEWIRVNRILALLLVFSLVGCSIVPDHEGAALVGSGVFTSASGESILAEYRDNQTVTLTLVNGETRVLTQAISGSGARYVLGAEEWWEHQGEATLSRDGRVVFSGKLVR